MQLKHVLQQAAGELDAVSANNGRLEAELLMAHALGRNRAWLYAHPEAALPGAPAASFTALLRKRLAGHPVAYLTGWQEFWSLPLQVSPAVLIPRPETELLVEAALARLAADEPLMVADIGTGSGAIALAIASERRQATVHASDISEECLQVARANAERLGLEVQFFNGSWCEPLPAQYALIASNPPYVRANDPHLQQGDLRFEPGLALSPGSDELLAFREISHQAHAKLQPGGYLVFEHGYDQAAAVRELLRQQAYTSIETLTDLGGHERITLAQKPAQP
jgi:release factor glutamine methyltransferase